MFSYSDLLIILIISLCFVFLFKLQKKVLYPKYFTNSELVTGSNVTYKMLLARFIITFLFGLLTYTIVKNQSVILIGTFLGSFLIVWPVFLNPVQTYSFPYSDILIQKKDEKIIFIIHFLFIITSVLTVYTATILTPEIINYTWNNRIELLLNFLFSLFLITFFTSAESYSSKLLDKKIRRSNETEDYSKDSNE